MACFSCVGTKAPRDIILEKVDTSFAGRIPVVCRVKFSFPRNASLISFVPMPVPSANVLFVGNADVAGKVTSNCSESVQAVETSAKHSKIVGTTF
ncbi:hypothetical protein DPMN_166705 [Dreissena polymorpha]|uniref:Uncharacterized protein n=1 Tax=Dreissena polymorpha TaxID=45954 RepID=A0A9D4EXI0_DREPO|nr:hypothetical protein DPMN_166705 [Dreissena polymorpha]